jgi:hypothetical protein
MDPQILLSVYCPIVGDTYELFPMHALYGGRVQDAGVQICRLQNYITTRKFWYLYYARQALSQGSLLTLIEIASSHLSISP